MRADAAPSFLLIPDLPAAGARVTLAKDESHYLTRVCRARPGERLSGTDGRGTLATLRVIDAGPLAVVEVESCERRTRVRTAWVLSGAPEGERGDWMVEKLAELGIATLQPIECERGGWERSERRGDRWARLAAAALRQSRRCDLMEIRPAIPLADALAALPPEARRFLADPSGLAAAAVAPPGEGIAAAVIGPAAGLSEPELAQIRGLDFQPIALSDARLRAETAAIAWAGWWAAGGAIGSAPGAPTAP